MRYACLAFGAFLALGVGQAFAASERIYAVSNKADENSVFAYESRDGGAYKALGEFKTGGKGTGDLEIPALKKDKTHPLANGDDPLIAANSLAKTDGGKYLVVVNPGDGTVSLMAVGEDGTLAKASTAKAPNRFPVSLAVHGDLVAVAAVGNTNNEGGIGLLKIEGGKLVAVEGSLRDLKARPSTIDFSDDGTMVIVNELVTGKIKVFTVESGNLSSMAVSTVDSPRDDESRFQAIPVGFAVSGNTVLMSEARFLTPDFKLREEKGAVVQSPLYSWQTSSISSYKLSKTGNLELVSGDVLTGDAVEGGEIANCWVALSKDGKTLWTANALSSSISSYRVRENGTLSLINARAYKDKAEKLFFSDMTVSEDGTKLYQLVGNTGEIMIFDIAANGDLTLKQTVNGLPKLGSYGLVAY